MAAAPRVSDPPRPHEGALGRFIASPWALVAILVVALAVYAPTFDDWFSFDDFWFLRSAQAESFGDYALDSLDFRRVGERPEFDRYRPLYPISWWLLHAAFGLDALGYRVVLVGLHLGCVALVWLIARRLTGLSWAASLAALIFAVHPAYAFAVSWIAGGNRVFVTLPSLVSFLLFMKYVEDERRRALAYAGSFASFLIAMLMHSTGITLTVALAAYLFLVRGTPRDALRPASWVSLVPFALPAAALVGIQFWVRDELGAEGFRFGWHQYGNYGRFLGLALFPGDIVPTPASGAGERLASVLEGVQGVASVALLGVSVLIVAVRRWPYLGAFAVCWLFAALLPDTTLRLAVSGRSMYLAGAPLALLLVALVLWARDALPRPAVARLAGVAPALVLLALVPVTLLAAHEAGSQGPGAAANERFVAQLRAAVPGLEPDAILYIVDPPSNLLIFKTETRLDALVELYYGAREVRALSRSDAERVGASLRPQDRIFQFRR